MPEFALDVARVGNECLGVVLYTLLTLMVVRLRETGLSFYRALCVGVVLGLGLLTKAYFLAALPALAVLLASEAHRSENTRRTFALKIPVIACAAALIAGWWYVRNLITTGTLSGLSEAVALRGTNLGALLQGSLDVDWPRAIDSILFSHIWFGGWSGLTVRSWIYHLGYLSYAPWRARI